MMVTIHECCGGFQWCKVKTLGIYHFKSEHSPLNWQKSYCPCQPPDYQTPQEQSWTQSMTSSSSNPRTKQRSKQARGKRNPKRLGNHGPGLWRRRSRRLFQNTAVGPQSWRNLACTLVAQQDKSHPTILSSCFYLWYHPVGQVHIASSNNRWTRFPEVPRHCPCLWEKGRYRELKNVRLRQTWYDGCSAAFFPETCQ